MSTPQITLTDCLAEVNNALNYWYPTRDPLRDGESDARGASQAEHDARHVRLFQFRDRLQQQLGAAKYDEVSAIWNTAIEAATQAVPGGNICDPQAVADAIRKLTKPRITAETFDLAMAMAELASVAAERDKARLHLASLQSCLNSAAKSVRESEIAANTARQSLRAAEADVDETESANSDLRTVNARLVADLAAAVQRADTAEAILRAKA